MKPSTVFAPLLVLLSPASAAPVARDSLLTAQQSLDLLLANLRRDHDTAGRAIRRLQTRVLNYSESVEVMAIWRQISRSHDDAVHAAEHLRQFLRRMEGIYGAPAHGASHAHQASGAGLPGGAGSAGSFLSYSGLL